VEEEVRTEECAREGEEEGLLLGRLRLVVVVMAERRKVPVV
jgi:hypothetical protein